jgi:hypothetical protein
MKVTIPKIKAHAGYPSNLETVEISDFCARCGAPRGKKSKTLSFDGSRRIEVDGWQNDCGHVDEYQDMIKEAYSLKSKKLITIGGSHGEIKAMPSGIVITRSAPEYELINKIDFDEYMKFWDSHEIPELIDILDIGYWNKDLSYIPAELDYRNEILLSIKNQSDENNS